jgi:hypothetical protein
MKKIFIISCVAVCFLTAWFCPNSVAAGDHYHQRLLCEDKVKVMTRNLYLGADIFQVLAASQNPDPALGGLDVPIAVATLFETVQYTNFPERAEAIAKEIWMTRPHLIGLQEVSLWYTQSPSDFFNFTPGGPVLNPERAPAEDPVYDYLTILLNALAAKGLHYEVAVSVDNADVELPMLTGFVSIPGVPDPVPTFDDLRLVDRDVILVRGDIDVSNPIAANYSNNLPVEIGGVELEFTRGWTAVDAEVCGQTYRFVNTHLEIASESESFFRVVQAAQMQELLTILSYETKPVVLVGDFNSSPQDVPGEGCLPDGLTCFPYVPPYMQATVGFDFQDAWDLIFWPRDGYTSSFDEFVSDPTAELYERIDLILLKPQEKEIKTVIALTTGDKPFSMTPGGLWPSDHAGVVARIKFLR